MVEKKKPSAESQTYPWDEPDFNATTGGFDPDALDNPNERPPRRDYISDPMKRMAMQVDDQHTMARLHGLVADAQGPLSVGEVILRVEEAMALFLSVGANGKQVVDLKSQFRANVVISKLVGSDEVLRQRVRKARKKRQR